MADTVEQWAPIFLFYEGTSAPKFKAEQVLDPAFALHRSTRLTRSFCKLCDSLVPEGETDVVHMKEHRAELEKWQARRRKEAAQRSNAGLKAARAARAETARVLAEITPEEDD